MSLYHKPFEPIFFIHFIIKPISKQKTATVKALVRNDNNYDNNQASAIAGTELSNNSQNAHADCYVPRDRLTTADLKSRNHMRCNTRRHG